MFGTTLPHPPTFRSIVPIFSSSFFWWGGRGRGFPNSLLVKSSQTFMLKVVWRGKRYLFGCTHMLACSCEVKCSMSVMSWDMVSNNLSRSRPMGWGCQNCYDYDAGCLEGGRYLDIVIWHVFMGTRCCCCTKHQAGWTGVPKCNVYQGPRYQDVSRRVACRL